MMTARDVIAKAIARHNNNTVHWQDYLEDADAVVAIVATLMSDETPDSVRLELAALLRPSPPREDKA